MNIPQDTLQAVADAAFLSPFEPSFTADPKGHPLRWQEQAQARRAVIQHAISNQALTPWLNVPQAWPPVGEYTDEEIVNAYEQVMAAKPALEPIHLRLRAFLAALPRRESPALAEAIARAEAVPRDALENAYFENASVGAEGVCLPDDHSEALEDVRGVLIAAFKGEGLPAAEATPPAEVAIIEGQAWVDPVCGCIRSPDAPKDSPCPICKPAAQVPLGPEDVPPGSGIRSKDQPDTYFWTVSQVWERGFYLRGECVDWHLAMECMEINTSIPDTGRWDANAWRPCSKPGKEVAK